MKCLAYLNPPRSVPGLHVLCHRHRALGRQQRKSQKSCCDLRDPHLQFCQPRSQGTSMLKRISPLQPTEPRVAMHGPHQQHLPSLPSYGGCGRGGEQFYLYTPGLDLSQMCDLLALGLATACNPLSFCRAKEVFVFRQKSISLGPFCCFLSKTWNFFFL